LHGAAYTNYGSLRLSADGGQTWQETAVPFASPIPPNVAYTWLGAVSWSSQGWIVGGAELRILVASPPGVTAVGPDLPVRSGLVRLDAPWPNPANPATSLRYHLAAPGPVLVTVHDVAGRHLRTLVRGTREAGPHTVVWHGDDDAGRSVAAGVYLVQVVSRNDRAATKVLLVK
jgi:hypothetical protein